MAAVRMRIRSLGVAALAVAACGVSAQAPSPPTASQLGRVVAVTAANSLLVHFYGDEQPRQVVLAYLAIPHGDMPYAGRAADVLTHQLLNREVNVRPVGRQGEDFQSALVYVRGHNFNTDFLQRGHAWVDHRAHPPPQWFDIQSSAQERGVGLWSGGAHLHPNQYSAVAEHAEAFLGGLVHIQKADDVPKDRFQAVHIGDREAKVAYSIQCARWASIPKHRRRIFLNADSVARAQFARRPCS